MSCKSATCPASVKAPSFIWKLMSQTNRSARNELYNIFMSSVAKMRTKHRHGIIKAELQSLLCHCSQFARISLVATTTPSAPWTKSASSSRLALPPRRSSAPLDASPAGPAAKWRRNDDEQQRFFIRIEKLHSVTIVLIYDWNYSSTGYDHNYIITITVRTYMCAWLGCPTYWDRGWKAWRG